MGRSKQQGRAGRAFAWEFPEMDHECNPVPGSPWHLCRWADPSPEQLEQRPEHKPTPAARIVPVWIIDNATMRELRELRRLHATKKRPARKGRK